MDTNPYQHSEGHIEAPPHRRLGILSRLGWFTAGFVAACVLLLGTGYVMTRPRDLTKTWPEGVRELVPVFDWTRDAVVHRCGRFVVIVPADPQNGSTMVYPVPPNPFPQCLFLDEEGNGEVDAIFLFDSTQRNLSIDVADGKFTAYNLSTGLADDSITFRDGNMDGQFDFRHGPGRGHKIWVNGQWRDFEQAGDTRYVDLDGLRTPLKLKDGVWQIVEEAPEDQ
jgi:hypothetical protein